MMDRRRERRSALGEVGRRSCCGSAGGNGSVDGNWDRGALEMEIDDVR